MVYINYSMGEIDNPLEKIGKIMNVSLYNFNFNLLQKQI